MADSSAGVTLVDSFVEMVNMQDINELLESQAFVLQKFEKTNEMLVNLNALSAIRFEAMSKEFRKNIKLLAETKKTLESVFGRIRSLKAVLAKQYPEEFEACNTSYAPPDE